MTTRETEFGTEKYCCQCDEWWPNTEEFFFKSVKGHLRSPCKACIDEKRAETNAVKPCCVPGCNQPRANWRSSRCWQHRYELHQKHYAMRLKKVQA